jgi:hypothetical protein
MLLEAGVSAPQDYPDLDGNTEHAGSCCSYSKNHNGLLFGDVYFLKQVHHTIISSINGLY